MVRLKTRIMNPSTIQHRLDVKGKVPTDRSAFGTERDSNNSTAREERSLHGTSPIYGIDDLAALSPTPPTSSAIAAATTTNINNTVGGSSLSNVANEETITLLLQQLSSFDSTEDTIEDTLMKLAHICTDTIHPISCQHHRQCLFGYQGQLLIVNVMRRFVHRAMIQYAGCRALTCSISSMVPAVKEHVAIENRAFDVTMTALDRHPTYTMVHISGCHFLANVISSMVLSPDVIDFMSNRGINRVVTSMRQFPKYLEMQRVGCLFFYNISCHCDKTIVDEARMISVMEVLLVAMLEFPKSRSMQCLGCRALLNVRHSHLTINPHQDPTRSHSIDRSIRNAVLSAINEFPKDPRVRQLENLLIIQSESSSKAFQPAPVHSQGSYLSLDEKLSPNY
jgi:hypothetical protein